MAAFRIMPCCLVSCDTPPHAYAAQHPLALALPITPRHNTKATHDNISPFYPNICELFVLWVNTFSNLCNSDKQTLLAFNFDLPQRLPHFSTQARILKCNTWQREPLRHIESIVGSALPLCPPLIDKSQIS